MNKTIDTKEYIYFHDPMHVALAEAIMFSRSDSKHRNIPLPSIETPEGERNQTRIYKIKPVKNLKQPKPERIRKERRIFDPSFTPQYINYLKRSEEKKMRFELSMEVFTQLTESDCTYCGKIKAGGVDRISSKEGYIEGNVTPCCFRCNMMKYTMQVEDFREHIRKVFYHMFL